MLEVKSISKNFGDFEVVKNVSFKANRGEILGFLGPNGASKSTTKKMITGFLDLSKGDAQRVNMEKGAWVYKVDKTTAERIAKDSKFFP